MTISREDFLKILLSKKQTTKNIVFYNINRYDQKELKRILKNKENDLIIEFDEEDIEEIEKTSDNISEDNAIFKHFLFNLYLLILIDYEIDKDKEKRNLNLNSIKNKSWEELSENIINEEYCIYKDVLEKTENKTIHFFIDNIHNTILQRNINDFYKNQNIITREYTSNLSKISYRTSNVEFAEMIENFEEYNEYNEPYVRTKVI